MTLDEDLSNQYEGELYDDNEEPIVELFTVELLNKLTQTVYQLDN